MSPRSVAMSPSQSPSRVDRLLNPILAFVIGTACCVDQAWAVNLRDLGLEQAWTAQTQVSADGRGVVSAELWLTPDQKRTFAVVELSESTVKVAADQLDSQLKPLGIDGAKNAARAEAARILGKAEGFEVVERSIGQLKLVITNGNGLVQCLDAESGRLLWATPCGDDFGPTFPAALSDFGVIVVRGDSMYVLDWNSGKQMMVKRLPSGTCNAVTAVDVEDPDANQGDDEQKVSNALVLVTDLTGLVSGYNLTQSIPPWNYRIVGRSVGAPVTLPDKSSTAIATTDGWMYVFSGARLPSVQFRYEAGEHFTGSLAAGDSAFYLGDASGKVSKISTRQLGSIEWSYRLPQSISSVPLIDFARGLVFVASEAGELTAIDDSTGGPAWNQTVLGMARVKAPIAVCNGSVICRTFSHSLVAFDCQTGQPLGQTSAMPLGSFTLVNSLTDRLYLFSRDGRLSCYRPIGRSLPKIASVFEGPTADKPDSERPRDGSLPSPSSRTPDSFDADDSDPFGEPSSGQPPSDSQPMDSDPFGEDSDPFADG